MKVKLAIFLMLVALTRTSVAVDFSDRRASSPDNAALNTSPANYQPDEVDALVHAANDGIKSLNTADIESTNAIDAALEAFAAANAGLDNAAASLAAVAAEIKAITQQIKALRDMMIEARSQIEMLSEKREELKAKADDFKQCTSIRRAVADAYARLIIQQQAKIADAEAKKQSTTSLRQELAILQNKRDEALRKLDASCSKLLSEVDRLVEQLEKTAKARRVLNKVSSDRTKASQLLQLIKENNRTALSEFLQREAGGGNFVISDARVATGPLLTFRVDSISHCLSAGRQCSGRTYLMNR